jgi:hypothetical protein
LIQNDCFTFRELCDAKAETYPFRFWLTDNPTKFTVLLPFCPSQLVASKVMARTSLCCQALSRYIWVQTDKQAPSANRPP